jgi:hypothetical protein
MAIGTSTNYVHWPLRQYPLLMLGLEKRVKESSSTATINICAALDKTGFEAGDENIWHKRAWICEPNRS